MITFSIITITYNAARYISRTTESVLQQSYPHIEHILVDGASTDSTLTLEKEYKRRSDTSGSGHHVIISSEPDEGLYDAMNKGLGMATGDYVCFMNAGDTLHRSNTIEAIVANTELGNTQISHQLLPAVLYGDTDIVDNEGMFLFHRRLSPPEHLSWLSFLHGMLVCHQAFYARTDIAQTIPYNTRYKYSADFDWCIQVMRKAQHNRLPIKNVHATVADYMQEGTTTAHHQESLRERYHIMCKYYGPFTTFLIHLWFVIRSVIKTRR